MLKRVGFILLIGAALGGVLVNVYGAPQLGLEPGMLKAKILSGGQSLDARPGASAGQPSSATPPSAAPSATAGRKGDADRAVPVIAATARVEDVPVYLDGVGTVKALKTVTVQPQIDGKLVSVNFREGQDVKRGEVLAEIDPVIYQAQLSQATAKLAQDQAQLDNARVDLERYVKLGANYATQKSIDTQRAQVAQFEAMIKSDQASIDNAKAFMAYTQIVAPIDGRTGIRQVDEGNIVKAAAGSTIVTITQLQPISVVFTLPQQQLAQINTAFSKAPLSVDAVATDNRTVTDRGTLQVVDNQVDQTTGTVKFKADFPNATLKLWPGQFVNIRLQVDTLKQSVVAPVEAVQRGPKGTYVFVVRPDSTVAQRAVEVVLQDDLRAVIGSGLQADEQVVITGFTRLVDGSKVNLLKNPKASAATADNGVDQAATSPPSNGSAQPRAGRTRDPVAGKSGDKRSALSSGGSVPSGGAAQ